MLDTSNFCCPRVVSLKMTVCRRVSGEGYLHRTLSSRPWSSPAMIVIGIAPFRCWTVEGFESLSGATANVDASLFCKVVECFCVNRSMRVSCRWISSNSSPQRSRILPFPRDRSLCSAEDRDFQGEEWLDHLHFAQRAMRSRRHTLSRDERGP